MTLLTLLLTFIKIGLLTIGGGLASLPIIKAEIVENHGWLTLSEFTDLITIAEMTPGPIGINASTFVGTKLFGLVGAITATVAYVIPSFIILSIFSVLYSKYKELPYVDGVLSALRPTTIALITAAGFAIMKLSFFNGLSASVQNINYLSVIIFAIGYLLIQNLKINQIYYIVSCGIVQLILDIFILKGATL